MSVPPLSPEDAARVEAIHAERAAIWRTDRGCGIDVTSGVKMDRLMQELQAIRDRQYGIVREKPVYAMPKLNRKKRKKLSRSVSRNLCKCDLERFKDELAPAAFDAAGRLVSNTTARPPRMPKATSVRTLCRGCHLPRLFSHAERWGGKPADYVERFHGFEASDSDAEYLDSLFAEWKEQADARHS